MDLFNIIKEKFPDCDLEHLRMYLDICNKECRRIASEKHHILPKSIWMEYENFDENPWNCATLSAYDHVIAHWHLAKATDCRSAWLAVSGVANWESNYRKFTKIEIDRLAEIRQEYRERYRGKIHHSFGKKRPIDSIEKQRKSITGRSRPEHSAALKGRRKSKSHIESVADSNRKAAHWFEPLKNELYNHWISMGKPKSGKFSTKLKSIGHDNVYNVYSALVKQFRQVGYVEGK